MFLTLPPIGPKSLHDDILGRRIATHRLLQPSSAQASQARHPDHICRGHGQIFVGDEGTVTLGGVHLLRSLGRRVASP